MQPAVLEGGEHLAQRGDLLVAGIFGDEARRHAFERRPGGDHLDHLAPGLAHHIDAAARHRAHEALALELRHGLAHRRAADAEILRQPALVEPDVGAAAVDVHRDDDVLQRRIGLVLEARWIADRIDRHVPRHRACRRDGTHSRHGRWRDAMNGHSATYWHTLFQRQVTWQRVTWQRFPPPSRSFWRKVYLPPCAGRHGRRVHCNNASGFRHFFQPQRSQHGKRHDRRDDVEDRRDIEHGMPAAGRRVFNTLAKGTNSAAVPFAVYSMP